MKRFNTTGMPTAFRDGASSTKGWLLNCYNNRVKGLGAVTEGCKSKPKTYAARLCVCVGIIETEIRPEHGSVCADYLLDLIIDLTK